jgi:diketogulonate reductase-like aldo/keto reductase
VSNDKAWRNLERLVKQGKARKAGTTSIFLAEQEHA